MHEPSMPYVEVTGEATATAVPDQAVVVLGTVTEGPELQPVQAENAAISARVIESLLQLGIPRENIQTQDYRIEPRYDYQNGTPIFRGYRATHLLQVTTGNVEQTGLLVDTAVARGANVVSSIRFAVSRPELYENRALELALRNAGQKAATIARTLGAALSPLPGFVQELPRAGEPVSFAASELAPSSAAPIQPGTWSLRAAVRVRYTLAR